MRWASWRRTTAALVLLASGSGCSGSTSPPDPDPAPDAESTPTTLESYDSSGIAVVRGPFCDRVSPTGIERSLGDVPADSEEWTDGDRERLPDGSRDRVHEYGCRWTAADGSQASAWVFAPPVTLEQARDLTLEVTRDAYGATCRPARGAADFGAPGATATCDLDTGERLIERAGLFGDAWFTCSLRAPGDPADLSARASEWCVQAVEAARS